MVLHEFSLSEMLYIYIPLRFEGLDGEDILFVL